MNKVTRQCRLFDADWAFTLGDVPGAEQANLDDSTWTRLNLPHDWSVAGPFREDAPSGFGGGYLPTGLGWYRKAFRLAAAEQGRRVCLAFDGVYKNSDVWINGHRLGLHPYGYTSFHYDLTPYLHYGEAENVLAVRVDNTQQSDARWYGGSGIYRHVWLISTDALHIPRWGTYVSTPQASAERTMVYLRTRVRNDAAAPQSCTLRTTILDAEGQAVATTESQHPIQAGQEHEFYQRLRVVQPRLWSVDDPYLYRVHSVVAAGETTLDEYDTPLGIREICFDADKGFLLNGQAVKLNGVCLHHDGGCVGAAVPERVWERRLEKLKEMGCNAIRSSHYPPAPEFLDLCDRLGFLVMDEAFDEWAQGKLAYGYQDYFAQWAIADLTSMLHRDRNHPSIVLWSVGNEILEQSRPDGVATLKRLVETVHQEDPTRPVTSACDNITAHTPTTAAFLELLDVVGYNYVDRWEERREKYYSDDHHAHPQWRVIGSENASVSGVRGDYSLEPTAGRGERWAPYHTRMIRAEQLWKFTRTHAYVAGDFMWTGMDHLGEAQWPHKGSSSGPLDVCAFPKDGFYFYQSQWTEQPMLHLLPHWTWPGHEGQVFPVLCYTNCDSVELFVNGRSWGRKSYAFTRRGLDRSKGWGEQRHAPPAWPTTADLHLAWDVPYQPGTLRAVGYKDGQVVCQEEVSTAGAPAQLEVSADRARIAADGRDVVHLTVRVLDEAGRLVPEANNLVTFAVAGEGRIIGVDNGDPTSHEPYQADHRHAFRGLCLAIIQATPRAGQISISVSAPGLPAHHVTVETYPSS